MPERYLVRLRHDGRYVPAEWPAIAARGREALAGRPARVGTVRVASRAVEIDLFTEDDAVEPLLERLAASIGPLIECTRLPVSDPDASPDAVVRQAVALFHEERYWEAHEVLEPLWLAAGGKASRTPEAFLLQGVILSAAALVHMQRAEDAVARRMLRTALGKLEAWSGDPYRGLDVAALRGRVRRNLAASELRPFRLV
jgi:hypothetical protein